MPTYGYECTACKHDFEIFQSIKDAVLTTCEKCGGVLRKRIYPVGIAFKGPGFYVNDYSNSKPSASKSTADTAASAEKPAEPSAPAIASSSPSVDAPSGDAKTAPAVTAAPAT
jgi:putative FmdB family regulatory protein